WQNSSTACASFLDCSRMIRVRKTTALPLSIVRSGQLTDGGLFRPCGKDRGELVERGDRIAQGGRHLVLGFGLDLRPVIDEEIALENLQRAFHRGNRLLVL